jgi:hypothetical protein
MQTEPMNRRFYYLGLELAELDPRFTPEQVRDAYSGLYGARRESPPDHRFRAADEPGNAGLRFGRPQSVSTRSSIQFLSASWRDWTAVQADRTRLVSLMSRATKTSPLDGCKPT